MTIPVKTLNNIADRRRGPNQSTVGALNAPGPGPAPPDPASGPGALVSILTALRSSCTRKNCNGTPEEFDGVVCHADGWEQREERIRSYLQNLGTTSQYNS